MKPFRRRQFVVSSLQRRLIVANVMYGVVLMFGIAAVLLLPLILDLKNAATSELQRERVAIELLGMHQRLWPGVCVAGLLFALYSIRLTHRLLGPLYRFTQVMKTMTRGDVSMRVRIRRDDFLHPEAAVFNEMLEALRARLDAVRAEAALLGAELERLPNDALSKVKRERLRSIMAALTERLGELETGRGTPQPRVEPAPALPAGIAEPAPCTPACSPERAADLEAGA